MKAQKSILTIQFIAVISKFLTFLVLDCQHHGSDQIVSGSICLKFSLGGLIDKGTKRWKHKGILRQKHKVKGTERSIPER
jgi:hypothetical protein